MSDTLNKKHSPAAVIMKRELAAYFTSPVAYIVTALFLIIANGKLVADSPTDELRERYGHKAALKLTAGGCSEADITTELKAIAGVENVSATNGEAVNGDANAFSLLVSVSETAEVRPALFKAIAAKGGWLYELAMQRNSLEDVFHELTTAEAQK